MAVRSVESAQIELGSYFEDFVSAIDAGTRHFWTQWAGDAHRITTCSRAGVIRCLIADELKQLVDGRPGVSIVEAQQTTTISIGPNWLVKIHKLDEGGQTAPNDTQARMDLDDNDLNCLPGMPDTATVVYLGYIEIVADRMNPEMLLVCPDGVRPAWVIDLRASLSAPPVPPIEITGGGDDGGTRVIVKRQDRKASH
jgi:hypothetical protein